MEMAHTAELSGGRLMPGAGGQETDCTFARHSRLQSRYEPPERCEKSVHPDIDWMSVESPGKAIRCDAGRGEASKALVTLVNLASREIVFPSERLENFRKLRPTKENVDLMKSFSKKLFQALAPTLH